MTEYAATVYRHFNADGDLLYVGQSIKPIQRQVSHRCGDAPWWYEITRIEMEHFGTTLETEIAELRAIRDEEPRYNKKFDPRRLASLEASWEALIDPVGWMEKGRKWLEA